MLAVGAAGRENSLRDATLGDLGLIGGAALYGCGLAGQMVVDMGFAPLGESLFFVWPKKSNQNKGHPGFWRFFETFPLSETILRVALTSHPWLAMAQLGVVPNCPSK